MLKIDPIAKKSLRLLGGPFPSPQTSTVALISPSSAVCERLFARLVMGFGDDQENALQDYKSASTIMRFNNSLMKSSGLVPY